MKIDILNLESELFGRNVLRIDEVNSAQEIVDQENDVIKKYDPGYIYLLIDSTVLSAINELEMNGFHFSEFRIFSELDTSGSEINEKAFYPYYVQTIGEDHWFQACLQMMGNKKNDDRFSNDPLIEASFSRLRNQHNLKRTYDAYPDEFFLGFFNANRSQILGFRSGSQISKHEFYYYQSGLDKKYNNEHYAEMLESLAINYLKQNGIQIIHAVTTGFNIIELNRFINLGFKVKSSKVILRKLYTN
jgi:hypothetical protein